jgi:hypothetical protein
MPSESARLRRPVERRDRRFLGIVLAAAVLAAPAGVVLAGESSKARPGCVQTLERGFMGGQTVTRCRKPEARRHNRRTALTDPPPHFTLGSPMLAPILADTPNVPPSGARLAPR